MAMFSRRRGRIPCQHIAAFVRLIYLWLSFPDCDLRRGDPVSIVTNQYARRYGRHYGWWSKFKDNLVGWKDAFFGIPLPDENLRTLRFFRTLISREKVLFGYFLRDCENALARGKSRLEQLLQQDGKSLADLPLEEIPENAQFRLEQYCELNRVSAPKPLPTIWYASAVVAFLVLEGPFNALAFQAFFGGSLIASLPAGLLAALILYGAAHAIEYLWSKMIETFKPPSIDWNGEVIADPYRSWQFKVFWIVALLAVSGLTGAGIFILGKMRQFYADFALREATTTLEQLIQGGVQSTVQASLDVPLRGEGYLFIGFNVALVVIAVVVAGLWRVSDRYLKKLDDAAKLENEIRSLSNDLRSAEAQIVDARMERADFVFMRLTRYRDANISFRRHKEYAAFAELNDLNSEDLAEEISKQQVIADRFK